MAWPDGAAMNSERSPTDLSVVAPVYNERENLEPFIRELSESLSGHALEYEIILVDDGSDDGSSEQIDELARSASRVRGLHLARNRGQSAAIDAGFKAARGRAVVTMDADLQNDPADIPALLAALEEYDAAVGYRRRRRDSWVRRLSSRIANSVRNRLSGDDIIDTGCSLKAFRRESLEGIKLYGGMHRFLPTLLRIEGRRVVQLPVNHRPRYRGTSKYGIRNRVFSSFQDLLVVRWMRKRRLDYEVVRHDP
jgi:glycosyltransferase involved in cell wall biosynthesis